MTPIIAERLAELDRFHLKSGAHRSVEEGVCVMELAAYVAGRGHTDSPQCVSPVIATFMRRWNDDLDDEGRQRLKPLIPLLLDTADPALEERRGWMAADWLIRTYTPAWLELAGIKESAAALRTLPELCDVAGVRAARPVINTARKEADAARAAAWDAAGDAARAAAWDAAGDAACSAAWAAARDAAWSAARDALTPTVESLQKSAYNLVERMCALNKEPVSS